MRAVLSALLALPVLGACGRDDPHAAPAPLRPAPAEERAAQAWPRVHTPELDRLRRLLDLGPLAEAETVLAGAAARAAGDELLLLRARFAALSGKGIEALRLVEQARAQSPADPSVFATAAEIYALSDGFDSAAREVLEGEQRCGPSAELLRARGVISILRPGGARKGLAELEAARRADPELPFAQRALGQAHLLLAKQAAKAEELGAATEHAQLSLSFDPDDVEARRFLADCLAARGDFDAARKLLEALIAAGEPLQAELASLEKRAGVACLLAKQRPAALQHFLRARAHGLGDAELATGARLLAEESELHLAAGVKAYEGGDRARAEAEFRAALEYDADSIAAQNHLGVVLLQRGAHSEAATLLARVLETARREGFALPEPVHLNLARAQDQAGERAAARATLDAYLAREPDGRWVAETRAALTSLER